MPTSIYTLPDGTRVPSVTTIINRFKSSDGLVHWAWKLGTEGKDYRQERDKAADAGTVAHALVEASVMKRPEPEFPGIETGVVEAGRRAHTSYLRWQTQSQLQIIEAETPLVSEAHRFGGTFDAIGVLVEEKCLLDWKTSNRLYGENLCQLAAYRALWEEAHPGEFLSGGFHLCRFGKRGDFHHHFWPELPNAWLAFRCMRKLYDLDVELKEMV